MKSMDQPPCSQGQERCEPRNISWVVKGRLSVGRSMSVLQLARINDRNGLVRQAHRRSPAAPARKATSHCFPGKYCTAMLHFSSMAVTKTRTFSHQTANQFCMSLKTIFEFQIHAPDLLSESNRHIHPPWLHWAHISCCLWGNLNSEGWVCPLFRETEGLKEWVLPTATAATIPRG